MGDCLCVVDEANQQRAAAYERRARGNGVSKQAATMAAARRPIIAAPSGYCVPDADWAKVP